MANQGDDSAAAANPSPREALGGVAQRLSGHILDSLRSVGVERGVDLALSVIFLRWRTFRTEPERDAWVDIAFASNVKDQRRRVEALLDTYLPPQLARVSGVTDVAASALPALIDLVTEGLPDSATAMEDARSTFEALLARANKFTRESGERETPESIAQLLTQLAVGSEGGAVLDPACGQGNALVAAITGSPGNTRPQGVELNIETARRVWMRLSMFGSEPDIRLGDAFTEVRAESANAVVLQPPWGLKWNERQRRGLSELRQRNTVATAGNSVALPVSKSMLNGDFPWLLLAQQALLGSGRAAVVLTHSSLNPTHRTVHDQLLHERGVEAIISLPAGGLFSHTSVRTAIWVLRKPDPSAVARDRLLFIDAQTLLGPSADGSDTPLGVEALAQMVMDYRESGTVSAPAHVARVVPHSAVEGRGLAPQSYLSAPPDEAVTHPAPDRRLISTMFVENFKAFGDPAEISLAPLTLIYGANSAGKSTLVQTLLLLRQSVNSPHLVTQGQMADVGSFSGIVHRHEPRRLGLGIEYGVPPTWIPSDGTPDPSLIRNVRWEFEQNLAGLGALSALMIAFGEYRLDYTVRPENTNLLDLPLDSLNAIGSAVAADSLLYRFGGSTGLATPTSDDDRDARRSQIRARNAASTLRRLRTPENRSLAVRRRGLTPSGSTALPWTVTAALDEAALTQVESYTNRIAQLGAGVGSELRTLLDNLVYLGPLRSAPQRFYDRATIATAPGDGHHVAMFLFDNSSVVQHVNRWLEELDVPYSLDVVPVEATGAANLVGDLVAIALTDRRTGVSVTPADVGFGISQVLPIIVELISRRESIICVEQPETHLHPRLQARLADLFIEAAQEGGRGNQLIVETHSEHLVLRLQRRMREGTLSPEQVSVVYVDQTDDGDTSVKQLRLDDEGNFLDEWPHGFFDERLEELFSEF